MRRFYVTRNEDGYKYSENVYMMGWSHCPDKVRDKNSLLQFLSENGRYDPPVIVFTDKDGKIITLYEIERRNGHIVAVENGVSELPLVRQHFVSDSAAGDFFKMQEPSNEVIQEADARSDPERLKIFQDNATPAALAAYNKFIEVKMSDEGITDYFKKIAASEGSNIEIIFK